MTNMRVAAVTADQREAWDAFVRRVPVGSFLQSWMWGEFQRASGLPVHRLAVWGDADALAAVCLMVERPLPLRRQFLYAPWGPVWDPALAAGHLPEALLHLRRKLPDVLSARGVFVRLEPRLPESFPVRQELRKAGFSFPGRSIQPKDTSVVDLTRSDDDLLRAMHPKTRYNIRLARRHGVTVEEETGPGGVQTFLTFAREVEQRGKFHYHRDQYYEVMRNVLVPAGMLKVLIARHQGLPLVAHLLLRFGDTVTYAHGASTAQRKHVMAPYLLQWEGMLRAKAEGAARYDLFGIAPPHAPATHPWFGMSRFKQGFGGTEEHYVGAMDLISDLPFYRLYEVGRSLRRLLR